MAQLGMPLHLLVVTRLHASNIAHPNQIVTRTLTLRITLLRSDMSSGRQGFVAPLSLSRAPCNLFDPPGRCRFD